MDFKSNDDTNKNQEILPSFYFIDLNQERIKDNYPIPSIEMLLQQVTSLH
jgi:hypothetical protein